MVIREETCCPLAKKHKTVIRITNICIRSEYDNQSIHVKPKSEIMKSVAVFQRGAGCRTPDSQQEGKFLKTGEILFFAYMD